MGVVPSFSRDATAVALATSVVVIACLGASLAPWVVAVHVGFGLAGLRLGSSRAIALIAASTILAASLSIGPGLLWITLAAVSWLLVVVAERRLAFPILVALSTAVPFGACALVLWRTAWLVEAERALAMAGACLTAVPVATVLWEASLPIDARAFRGVALVLMLPVVAVFAGLGTGDAVPAWPTVDADSGSPTERLIARERVAAAGVRDAGYALVSEWYEKGADIDHLRRMCPVRGTLRNDGDQPRVRVEEGREICRLLSKPWEPGGDSRSSLLRLDVDRALAAGDIDEAERLAASAPIAIRRHLDSELWRRGRGGRSPVSSWSDFNLAMDFGRPGSLADRGLRLHGSSAELRQTFSSALGGFALTPASKRGGYRTSVEIPVPPAAPLPTISVRGMNIRGFRLVFSSSSRSLQWGCGVGNESGRVELPKAMCSGKPAVAEIDLRAHFSSSLTGLRIVGEPAIAELRAVLP